MDPILFEATQERERLQKDIEERQARIAEIESFLRTYNAIAERVSGKVQGQQGVYVQPSVFDLPPTRTIKETVIIKSVKLLSDGRPRHTRDIVDALAVMGVQLRANDKVLQVSKILSTNPKFVADRSKGWSLAATKGEGPEVGASEPSDARHEPRLRRTRTPTAGA